MILVLALAASTILNTYLWLQLYLTPKKGGFTPLQINNTYKTYKLIRELTKVRNELRAEEGDVVRLNHSLKKCLTQNEDLNKQVNFLNTYLSNLMKNYTRNLTKLKNEVSSLRETIRSFKNASNLLLVRTSLTKVPAYLRTSFMREARSERSALLKYVGVNSSNPVAVFKWVELNLYYEEDPFIPVPTPQGWFLSRNLWKLPNETLITQGGDCEDFSLLIFEVLMSSGYQSWILVVSGEGLEHAAVLARYGEGWYLLDATGNWLNGEGFFLALGSGKGNETLLPPLTLMPAVKKELLENKVIREVWFNYTSEITTKEAVVREFRNLTLLLEEWNRFWGLNESALLYGLLNEAEFTQVQGLKQVVNYLSRVEEASNYSGNSQQLSSDKLFHKLRASNAFS